MNSNKEPLRLNTAVLEQELKTGDLVLRRGKGIISRWFASMSKQDPFFSHAGIIISNGSEVQVLSCTQDALVPGLVHEELRDFLHPTLAGDFAVYRLPFKDTEREQLSDLLLKDAKHSFSFDHKFDMESDSVFYCTEYIYNRINQILPGAITVSHSGDWAYIAPEDLYLHNAGRFIFSTRKLN